MIPGIQNKKGEEAAKHVAIHIPPILCLDCCICCARFARLTLRVQQREVRRKLVQFLEGQVLLSFSE
jgi:ribosomal protein S26